MSSLTEQSETLKKLADELLSSSNLLKILGKYGQVTFVGSYSAGLMMHGDIDIHILREKDFTKEETLDMFNEIVLATKFNSYYIGDWNDSNAHPEFPYGYYVGLKKGYADVNWKIDMWFVSTSEQELFDQKNFDVTKISLTDEERTAILTFKKYRQENGIKISGQKIYEMVINKGMRDLENFKKQINS